MLSHLHVGTQQNKILIQEEAPEIVKIHDRQEKTGSLNNLVDVKNMVFKFVPRDHKCLEDVSGVNICRPYLFCSKKQFTHFRFLKSFFGFPQ